ncbi:MAG: RecX family transcriptional regulator [Bacteroidota bacterium]|nr:RecX family transcriptional regulator [Bacteroidota bacterium]MDX5403892.1 RecX family transcriptional regulator [Bacteroidota bacterium]MDX5426591.1 RecX family transcriptional regulator [Bacteroidota bacterium]MDX5449086.1 RecX family transcriptional regulator [Bacteroidota bacterium]MDX5504600.1 RecX family transcriptional regulator [Bacteroidota bacterium]
MAMFKGPGKIYDLNEARTKIRAFCAYRERSQNEVEDKLRSYGLGEEITGELLVELIQEGFLNEQRFAEAFVRGKFNQKRWGKYKIRMGLRKHHVPEGLIDQALKIIDTGAYLNAISEQASKWQAQKGKADHPERRRQLIQFLRSRGFEYEMIKDALDEPEDD